MNQEITVNNQVYVAHPEPDCSDICSGCAFDKDEEGCNIASNMQTMCGKEMIIWKKKEEPVKDDYYVEDEIVVGKEYTIQPNSSVVSYKATLVFKTNRNSYLFVFKDDLGFDCSAWVKARSIKLNKKVDWTKVPIDTKIIVAGLGKRHFAGVSQKANVIKYFGDGATSWSSDELNVCNVYIDHVKLA